VLAVSDADRHKDISQALAFSAGGDGDVAEPDRQCRSSLAFCEQ